MNDISGNEPFTITAEILIGGINWKDKESFNKKVMQRLDQNKYMRSKVDDMVRRVNAHGLTRDEASLYFGYGAFEKRKDLSIFLEKKRGRPNKEKILKELQQIGVDRDLIIDWTHGTGMDIKHEDAARRRMIKLEEREARERAQRRRKTASNRAKREREEERAKRDRIADANRKMVNNYNKSKNRGLDVAWQVLTSLFPGMSNSRFYRGANYFKDRYWNRHVTTTPSGKKQENYDLAWNRILPDVREVLFQIYGLVKNIYEDRIKAVNDAIGVAKQREAFINNMSMNVNGRAATEEEARVYGAHWEFAKLAGLDANKLLSDAIDIHNNSILREKMGITGKNVNDILTNYLNILLKGRQLGVKTDDGRYVTQRAATQNEINFAYDKYGRGNLNSISNAQMMLRNYNTYGTLEGLPLYEGNSWRYNRIMGRVSPTAMTNPDNFLNLIDAQNREMLAQLNLYGDEKLQKAYYDNQVSNIDNNTAKLQKDAAEATMWLQGIYSKIEGKKEATINDAVKHPWLYGLNGGTGVISGMALAYALGITNPIGMATVAGIGLYHGIKASNKAIELSGDNYTQDRQAAFTHNNNQINQVLQKQIEENTKKAAEANIEQVRSFHKLVNSNTYTTGNDGNSNDSNSYQ